MLSPMPSPCLVSAFAIARVESFARFARHAEAAVVEGRGDVLAGSPHHGELEIVNAAGAVHHEAADGAPLHEIHHDGRQAHLDEMGAEAPDHCLAAGPGTRPGLHGSAQLAGAEDGGQSGQELREGSPLAVGRSLVPGAHLAPAAPRGDRAHLAAIDVRRPAAHLRGTAATLRPSALALCTRANRSDCGGELDCEIDVLTLRGTIVQKRRRGERGGAADDAPRRACYAAPGCSDRVRGSREPPTTPRNRSAQ